MGLAAVKQLFGRESHRVERDLRQVVPWQLLVTTHSRCLCPLVTAPHRRGVGGQDSPGTLPWSRQWASLWGRGWSQGGAASSDRGWACSGGPRPSETPEGAGPVCTGLGLLPLLQGQPRAVPAEQGACAPGWRGSLGAGWCVSLDMTAPSAPQLFHLQNDAAALAALESSLQLWVLEFSGFSETAHASESLH